MLYLSLAILSSAMVSTVMRLWESRISNNMGMFVANYAICAALSAFYMEERSFLTVSTGLPAAVVLGLLSGVLFLANFVLLQMNIQRNGVVLAATFMKLGVLIPTIMAVTVFREQPKPLQLVGIALAVAAIILINFEKEGRGTTTFHILLMVLLLVSGFTDSMANIYDEVGSSTLKDHYLLFTFLAAGLCALVLWHREKQKLTVWDVLSGICIGVPNYYSSRFLLLALHQLPAVIVYPVYSVLAIVVVTTVGILLFREHLSRKKFTAIAMIFAALALLNL